MSSSSTFIDLEPPVGKYKEILDYALTPHDGIRALNLCCGLGFGKTVVGLELAVLALNYDKNQRVLFLEPDWDRIGSIFLPKWHDHIPPDCFHQNKGDDKMEWYNGSYLLYRPRVITGSVVRNRDRFRGIEFSAIIDDETAIGFDLSQYINNYARIRRESRIKFYATLTTPKVGSYQKLLEQKGSKLFRGRTADNHYLLKKDPDYETRLRSMMSEPQARRELDGEMVALEGKIWPDFDYSRPWPHGNRQDEHAHYKKGEPWWLFADLGSATGAYIAVQRFLPMYRGRTVFDGYGWVAIADFCPDNDASASRAFQRMDKEFGRPVAVVAGLDINTHDKTNGLTVSYFAENMWPNVEILPCDEGIYSKQIQYDVTLFLIKSAVNQRRFCVARDFVALDRDSNRGLIEMFEQDAHPSVDRRNPSQLLPKGAAYPLCHIRDGLLMGSARVMMPPEWGNTKRKAA